MRDNRHNDQLDNSIKEVLKNASLPYSSESWTEMEQMLEKNPGKYGSSLGEYSQYFVVGALGLVIVGGMLYMIFRSNSSEPQAPEVKTETLADTSRLIAAPMQDTSKKEQASVDSTTKNHSDETTSGQEGKRSAKDSLTLSSSSSQESTTDTTGIKKKKKKKKKSGLNKDSLKAATENGGQTGNRNNPVPTEETKKDTSK